MKKILLSFALIIGLLTSASTLQAQVNMSRYITLTVTNGAAIKLDFMAATNGTPVRIVSGSNTKNITVDTGWYDGNAPSNYTVTAGASTMTVYGDLTGFYCEGNEANLTALDPSHNTQLKELWCGFNQLTTLDVSNNTQLMALSCHSNQLTSLDVSKNTQLKWLYCFSNQLISLDVSKNTQLTKLYCNNNSLNSLDISHNTQLTLLSCPYNGLSSLDVSNNTQLEALFCHGNNLSTQALDDIYCSLPDRRGKTNGWIQPVYSNTLSDNAIVLATNKANAINKNWKVQYYKDNTDIPATTGTYTCPQLNMSSYITFTVKKDSAIKLDLRAAAKGTPVRIVSGSNTQDITVGTSWTGFSSYTADGTTMTVYGDITGFSCFNNRPNITAINVSHNTQLTELDCSYNTLSSLDVSHNTQLKTLYCSYNTLSSLDVSKNTQLTELWCFNNTLTSLDVSGCTQLTGLNCGNNSLNSLDISQNTQLEKLYCSDNKFTTATLDDIYCALPDRTGKSYGWIQPVYNSSSSNHATVLATNAQNAITKNWKVQYYKNDIDIPTTTGSYVCGTPHIEPNMNRYITLTVKDGEAIRLNFKAAADDTPVRIVSGSNKENITVGTNWIGIASYTANGTEMTIYGDITRFNCSGNGANLTAIDPSHNMQLTYLDCSSNLLSSLDISKNTKLTTLYCHGNNLSTQALDDIFCALPDRTGKEYGVIQPVYNSSSSNHATVLATNAANATAKNWKVQYYDDNTDIPATTGSYVCPVKYDLSIAGVQVTSANCSDLSVIPGVSGTVKYDPTNEVLTLQNATIQKTDNRIAIESNIHGLTIKVIGTNNLTSLMYFDNTATITGGGTLNVEIQNYPAIYAYETDLTIDGCTVNAKGKWGIAGEENTNSGMLTIKNSTVTAEGTYSSIAHFASLTIDGCTVNAKGKLGIAGNEDSSGMLAIKNSTVTAEGTFGSIVDFASLTLDGCAITQPAGAAFDASLHAVALGGAVVKSKVVISKSSTDIAEAAAEPQLTLYPNPVADVLYLSATARTIRVYNIYGIEVAHATDTDRVEVSHLPAGIYTVKADDTVAKMVKR